MQLEFKPLCQECLHHLPQLSHADRAASFRRYVIVFVEERRTGDVRGIVADIGPFDEVSNALPLGGQTIGPRSDSALRLAAGAFDKRLDGRDLEGLLVGADYDGQNDYRCHDRGEQRPPGCIQAASAAPMDNRLDASLEVPTRHAGCAYVGPRQANLTDLQNARGVNLGRASGSQYFFIAGTFPFFDEARLDPPYQRMEPENRLHQNMNGRSKVVMTTDVALLVRDDRVEFFSGKMPLNGVGQNQALSKDAYHGGFAGMARLTQPTYQHHERATDPDHGEYPRPAACLRRISRWERRHDFRDKHLFCHYRQAVRGNVGRSRDRRAAERC